MPSITKLSDAAIAINDACREIGVEFGIFGGYAVAVLGGPRESKDIDCVVNCEKEWLVEKLSQIRGFRSMGNTRADLASFLYGDENILIEFFPASMSVLRTIRIAVTGHRAGQKETKVLDPVLIYKGKLQAAATRTKHPDAADLLFLEGKHRQVLQARRHELNTQHIGLALKRNSHLAHSFGRLGVDMDACRAAAEDIDIGAATTRPPPLFAVQSGLLYNSGRP